MSQPCSIPEEEISKIVQTGADKPEDAFKMALLLAEKLGCEPGRVLAAPATLFGGRRAKVWNACLHPSNAKQALSLIPLDSLACAKEIFSRRDFDCLACAPASAVAQAVERWPLELSFTGVFSFFKNNGAALEAALPSIFASIASRPAPDVSGPDAYNRIRNLMFFLTQAIRIQSPHAPALLSRFARIASRPEACLSTLEEGMNSAIASAFVQARDPSLLEEPRFAKTFLLFLGTSEIAEILSQRLFHEHRHAVFSALDAEGKIAACACGYLSHEDLLDHLAPGALRSAAERSVLGQCAGLGGAKAPRIL